MSHGSGVAAFLQDQDELMMSYQSAFESSSSSMGFNNSVGDDGSPSSDNHTTETEMSIIRPPRADNPASPTTLMNNMRDQIQNRMATNNNPVPTATTSMMGTEIPKSKFVMKKKGFLASMHTLSTILFGACGSLFWYSFGYPLAPKALQSFGNPWMQVITIGSLIASISSGILYTISAYLKDSELIDGAEFQFFRWLLLKVLLFLFAVIHITMQFCAKISSLVIWPLTIFVFLFVLFVWHWLFYKWIKNMEGMNDDNVGENGILPQTTASEPTVARRLQKYFKSWTDVVRGKTGSYPRGPTHGLPGA